MKAAVTTATVALAVGLAGGCSSERVAGSGDDDCVSHYDSVVGSRTWPGLRDALLLVSGVDALRTQERGADIGIGNRRAVRVVDLLDDKGRRVAQVEVWRTRAGGWRAGQWSQCID